MNNMSELEIKYPVIANIALGMFKYSIKPLGSYSAPVCIVQLTRGERRLGTHGLAGLAQLLPLIIKESDIDFVKLSNAFPSKRQKLLNTSSNDPLNEPFGYPSTAMIMTDHNIAVN